MTVLTPPRPAVLDHALDTARAWCAGHHIDQRPALAHAARVAVVLGEHITPTPPEWTAAALLHDAPEFAPTGLDLDALLEEDFGHETRRIVRALQNAHQDLDAGAPTIPLDDPPVLACMAADKIVALSSMTRRAHASGDPTRFLTARPALLAMLPHFHHFHATTTPCVPASMSRVLGDVLAELDALTPPTTAAHQGR